MNAYQPLPLFPIVISRSTYLWILKNDSFYSSPVALRSPRSWLLQQLVHIYDFQSARETSLDGHTYSLFFIDGNSTFSNILRKMQFWILYQFIPPKKKTFPNNATHKLFISDVQKRILFIFLLFFDTDATPSVRSLRRGFNSLMADRSRPDFV